MKKFTRLLSLLFFLQIVWSSSIYGQVQNLEAQSAAAAAGSSYTGSRTATTDPVTTTDATKKDFGGKVALVPIQSPATDNVGRALVFPANVVKRTSATTNSTAKVSALSLLSGPVTQTFNYTGSIQTFTVPAGITSININGRGAQGGNVSVNCSATGGKGAQMVGDFAVTPGEVLSILVGQQGNTNGSDAGGGGGTYVVRTGNVALLVAGGGGGASNNIGSCGSNLNGIDASITTSGTASANGLVAGGINGNGGGASSGSGGGGGGFSTDGTGGSGNPNSRGKSYLNGGIGGTGNNNDGGGYGGGGAGWFTGGNGGGGGGYSGGGTSGSPPYSGGGGGGSFSSGTNQANLAGVQSGNGLVTITYTAPPIYSNDYTSGIDNPSTLDANIFSTLWASSNPLTNPSGELLSKGFSTGSGTLTLTIKVKCGYELDISSIALKHRRDISGPQNLNLIVGGTTVQSAIPVNVVGAPAPTALGSPYSTTSVASAQNIIGQVIITLDLVNASSGGEYYLDDFVIEGTVTSRVQTLTATIPSATVCEGSPANFTGTFTATGVTGGNPSVAAVTPAYQWEKNAANASGTSTNLNYSIASTLSPADNGAYRLGLRFTGCAAGTPTEFYTTPSINLVVNKVTAAITPTTASVCVNSTTPLTGTNTVVATATVASAVWTSNNGNATVSTTGVVTGAIAGTSVITYTVTDNNGCSSSSTATVTVNPLPTPSVSGTTSICAGSTSQLTGTLGFNSPATSATAVWSTSASGVATVDGTGLVSGVSAGSAIISYTVTDNLGCIATSSVTVTVKALPVPTITGVTPVCVGSTMAPTYTPGFVAPAVSATAVWTSSATGVATVNTSNGVVSGVSSGTSIITYTVTDNLGCSSSTTTTVTVNPLPTISLSNNGVPSGQVCIGNIITINGNATGSSLTHSWTVTSGTGAVTNAGTSSATIALTGTSAGTVTVVYTVTSGAGCSTSSSMVVTVNGLPNNPTITGSLSICEGDSTTLTGSAPGGSVGPYFTDWTGSGPANVTPTYGITTAKIVSNVPALTPSAGYLVGYSVSDGNGCINAVPASATVTVFAKPSTASIPAGNQTQCNTSTFTVTGNTPSVGSGTWTVTGGVVTSSTSATTTITGVSAGTTATATWTITNGSCGATSSNIASVTLTNNVLPTITATPATQAACNTSTFSISSTKDVGTGVWTTTAGTVTNTTSTSTTVTGIPVGTTQTLTWTVTNGTCTASTTITVTNTAPPSAAVITTSPQKQCGAGVFVVTAVAPTVGTGTWTVVGGTAQSPSSNTTFVTGVAPGTVATATWTVSSGPGCPSTSASVTLTNYQAPTGVNAGIDQSKCNDMSGTFSLSGSFTPLVGVTDLHYSWTATSGTFSSSTSTVTNIMGVAVGSSATATFTVTNGVCTAVSDQVVLNNYTLPTATVTPNIAVCNRTMSDPDFTVVGTPSPASPTLGVYAYAWTVTGGTIVGSTTGTSIAVDGVPGTTATLTFTVTNGSCSTSSSMTITNDLPVTASIPAGNQTLCSTSTFSVVANNPSPGTGIWTVTGGGTVTTSNSSTTTITGVAPGTTSTATWTVTNGTCSSSTSVTLTNVGTPTASITTPSSIKCNEAGSFTVQAGALTFGTGVWTITNGTINGSNTGTSVSVTVTPGVSATTATVVWTVTNGICGSSSSSITIENRPALTAMIVPNPANPTEMCPGTSINLQATPNGGPGRVYASQSFVGGPGSGTNFIVNFNTNPITNPNRLATINGLAPQNPVTLTYTIIDNAGCTFSTQFVTKVNPPIVVTVPATNVCVGSTVTVTPSVTGGSGSYATYSWSLTNGSGSATGGSTGSTFPVTGTTAGTVNVVYSVVDNQTCPASSTATGVITVNPLPVVVAGSPTNVSCFGGSNGAVTVTGATSYTISPLVGTQGSAGVFTGLSAGTYTVVGTSGFGCTSSTSVTITQPTQVVATVTVTTPVACNGGMATLTITPSGGTPGYSVSSGTFTPSVVAGTYTYIVTDANGCTASTSITVGQPTPVVATISASTNVSCFGGSNGSATAAGSGGTPGYTYSWAPSGGTSATATGLAAGTYTVTVRDANSCSSTASIVITQPTLLVASITASTNVSCNGGSNGSATVTPSGGTPGYTYSWSHGPTAASVTGLSQGTYTVTVFDANGCSTSTSVTISQPTALLAGASQNTPPSRNGYGITCFGGSDGSATAAAFGGTPGYTYLWNNGETTVVAMMLSAGLATVTVTDANGCSTVASVTMTQPPTPVSFASATFTATSCAVGQGTSNNGTITVSATGGVSPYTYAINPTSTQGSPGAFSGLTAGTYTITVTDANSCTATTSVTVTAQNPIVATTSAVPPAICSGTSTIVSATGGATYAWTSAVTGQSATVSPSTSSSSSFTPTITQPGATVGTSTVTFTVTVSSGVCSTTATTTVTVNPLPFLTGVTSPDPICSDAGAFNFTFTGNNNGANSLTIGNPSPSLSGFPQTLSFTSSPVGVVLPSPLTSNSYNLSYRVRNTTTGCFSDADPSLMTSPVVVVNVRPRPVATVLAISGPTELCDAAPTSMLQVTTTGPNNSVVGAYPRSILIQGPAGQFTITIPGTSDAAGTSSGTAAITVAGVYTVIGITDGTSCAGTITSGSTTLRDGRFTVTPSANSSTIGYVSCSVSLTANEVFTTPAFSTGTLTRQWQFKTSAIAPYSDLIGETGATLTLTNLLLSQNGYIYRMKVIGTGACGGVDKYSGEVTLTVTNFPAASAGSDQTIAGTTFTLAATLPVGTTGAWTVVTPPATGTVVFANSTSPTTTVTLSNPNTTATLRWTVTASGGCSTFDDVVISRVNISLNATVFLEGPMNAGGTAMATSLATAGLIPLTFNGESVSGASVFTANGIVDWVTVQIRISGSPGANTLLATRSALLKSNGQIVDLNGTSPLIFPTIGSGTYNVAVLHRNHLALRTTTGLTFTGNTTVVFDFSSGVNVIGGKTKVGKRVSQAGNGNGDGTINILDKGTYNAQVGTGAGYKSADFNLSGSVNIVDLGLYNQNTGVATQPNLNQ